MSVRVSVVLPAYERHESLAHCLSALIGQDYDPEKYEIIVVDEAGSEKTRRLVEEQANQRIAYCFIDPGDKNNPGGENEHMQPSKEIRVGLRSGPALRYLPDLLKRGPAAARNQGWRSSQGEIIAFTEEDCIPSSGWLRSGCRGFEAGAAGVSGQIIVPVSSQPTDYELSLLELEQADFAAANCFYKRSVLEELGGFDERFTQPCQEDSDLFFSLLERRHPLVTAPEAIVFHPPGPAPWGISLAQQRKRMFQALLFKKHPDLCKEMQKTRFPGIYYWSMASLLLSLGAGISGYLELSATALFIWLLITLVYSLQRLQNTRRSPRHIMEMIFTSALIPPLAIFWRLWGAIKFRAPFF